MSEHVMVKWDSTGWVSCGLADNNIYVGGALVSTEENHSPKITCLYCGRSRNRDIELCPGCGGHLWKESEQH